jgi:hypothetical protein
MHTVRGSDRRHDARRSDHLDALVKRDVVIHYFFQCIGAVVVEVRRRVTQPGG